MDLPPEGAQEKRFSPSYPHLSGEPNAQRHFINNAWQNVRIVSQIAESSGSEALFPFLDDDVALALHSLPDELKINKVLLRLLLARQFPRVRVTAKKRGYWAHTIRWVDEAKALGQALDLMSDRTTLERGIYDRIALTALVDAYRSGRTTPQDHPVFWQLLLFEAFCREFVDHG